MDKALKLVLAEITKGFLTRNITKDDDESESDVKFQQFFACGGRWVGGLVCFVPPKQMTQFFNPTVSNPKKLLLRLLFAC